MRQIYFAFFVTVILLTAPIGSKALSEVDVSFSSETSARGDLILITIKADKGDNPRVNWMDKEIALIFDRTRASWKGFIATDLNQKAGAYKVLVQAPSSGFEKSFDIKVTDKDYGVRNLTIPKEKVELDSDTLERVKSEAAVVKTLWDADPTSPEWNEAFLIPVDSSVVGAFGRKSIINNLERSPHTGVDLRGGTGTPVKATNNGRVILVADHFFTGNALYVDHGGGIISMYFHLDKVLVKDGDKIKRGQVIGLIGATGRATGPHLHWGVRINGSRVNPMTLIKLSKGL